MGSQRIIARQVAPPEKRAAPKAAPAVRPAAAPAIVHRAEALQQRLGNQGMHAFIARSEMRVSSPADSAEHEARSTAARVMRMDAPAAAAAVHSPAGATVHRDAFSTARNDAPLSLATSHEIASSMFGGAPLPASVRGFMEPRFNADFAQVRIHTDSQAARLSEAVGARAFTAGRHVYFGQGQYRPDSSEGKELIAHELTHVVQEGAAGASRAGAVRIQREEKKGLFDELTDFGESVGWGIVRDFAPEVEPILRKGPEGVFDWFKERATAAAEGLFSTVTAPVRMISGFGAQLSAQFAPLLAAVKTAGAQITRNDCTPLREAAEKIEKTAESLILPIVQKLQPVVAKIEGFFNAVWDKIGAPIWDLIKDVAAAQWAQIQWIWKQIKAVAGWIWKKTETFRSLAGQAWTWLKNKLGIGEGAEGEDGLLQWVQRKLEAAWKIVKDKIEPFKKELTTIGLTVGAVALAISPAGPIVLIGTAVGAAVQGLRWIHANWGKGNLIVQARVYIEKTLIPPLLGAATRLGAAVTRLANSLSTALGNLAASMTRAVGALANSLLKVAVAAVQWIADQAQALAAWATEQLSQLSTWLNGALAKLQQFMRMVLEFLSKVGKVVLDIWGLPLLLAEKVWSWVPACIRDPIVDFIGPIILRQIEIFQELAKDDEAWQKTKIEVGKIIRLVFKDHDLMGAVKATFYLILRVFNVPPDLLVTIAAKALAAWDVVSKKPLQFIKNIVRAMGHGFLLLWQHIDEHLKFGLEEWLFGPLKEKNIAPPASWTDPKAVFGFTLDVLGLSMTHIWELLAKRFHPDKIAAVRGFFGAISRAWDWVKKAIDTSKSPQENTRGLIDKAKDFGKTILTGIVEWIAGKVATELAIMAAAAAASAGLSEVLDIVRRIYKAILTAVRWARRILDMVNETLDSVLEIASGKIESVGQKFENILHRGMPVVIGFLADQVGLGGVGQKLRELIDGLRAKVDDAILWLIDMIKAGIDALVGAVKAGIAAVKNWWKKEVPIGDDHTLKFSSPNARIAIYSSPKTVPAFLLDFLTVKGSADQIKKANAMDVKISATQAKLIAADARKDDVEVAKLSAQLNLEIDALGAILQLLAKSGAEEGSEKNPLQIDYPKRRASAYPDIYVGPRVGEGVRLQQKWLKPLVGEAVKVAKPKLLALEPNLAGNKGFLEWKDPVKALSPVVAGQDVDNKKVGLSAEVATLGPGKVLVYTEKGSTGGGHKVNDCFKPYGFVPSSKGGEGMDGDHVLERQLGGEDELWNLWPLPLSENRSGGSTLNTMNVMFKGEEMTVHKARIARGTDFLFLLIRSVKSG